MRSRLPLWIARRVVRAVAFLVPSPSRADWIREWEAELFHQSRSRDRDPRAARTGNLDLIVRSLGAVPDAAWIRRQFTLDADAVHDAVHGVRLLLGTPGFTAIALIVFAVGIGATTAIVSLADALLLRALPVPQADRVMTIWQHNRDTGGRQLDVAPGNAIDWLTRTRSFQAVAVAEPWRVISTLDGREPQQMPAARVSDQFFTVLGVPMLHGRAFLPQEYKRGGARVAILSHVTWRDRFGGDPSIVGRAVRLDTADSFTVVGVLPPSFELRLFDNRVTQPEPLIWLPKQGFEPFEPASRGDGYWNVLGRLAEGVSVEDARVELDALSAQLAGQFPRTNRSIGADVVPLRSHLAGSLRQVLPLLLGAAAILLIVACANVANLLLARGVGRGREFAVRQALGASRGRLVRQMLAESLLLAAIGGTAGLGLARWILDAIARLRPLDVARVDRIPIDARAAAIAVGVIVLAAIAAGLAPSLQLSRPAAARALHDGRSSARYGVRRLLAVMEIAAALVLAVGAGLLVRSFLLIQRVDPGFSRERVAVVQVFASPRLDTPQKRIGFFEQALERMRGLPGVVAAGGITAMPFGEARVAARAPIAVSGRVAAPGDESMAYTSSVAGDYFAAMGVPLVAGRLFEATDTPTSRQVVLVSRAAARRFWHGSDPVGARVTFRAARMDYDAEVVGVVGDVRHEALDREAPVELFIPYSQSGFYALTMVVRTAPGSPATLQVLKEQVWALDPRQSIFHTAMLDHLVSRTLGGRRFNLFLIGGFALATVILAIAGVYGVMSFTTSQRTREFGVRMALGAARGDIARLVLGDGLKLALAGVIAGLVLAVPLTSLLRALLFGVTATDPITFLTVTAALVLVTAAACYVPASRALKVDPVESLRVD